MDFTASTFVTILAVIGFLALIVSIITEVTKGVAILSKIPTNLQVIVLSITLTLVAYFAYISYSGSVIIWYYIAADIIAGFTVAYVTLYGWDKLAGLYKKFRNIPAVDLTASTTKDSTLTKAVDSIDTALNTNSSNTASNTEPVNQIEGETDDTSADGGFDLDEISPDITDNSLDQNEFPAISLIDSVLNFEDKQTDKSDDTFPNS
ncbi:MAG: hypothetical protein QM644_02425 [Mobilitalea sp.]